MDNPYEITLIGTNIEKTIGKLDVNIIPTDHTGWNDPPEELIPNEPDDLLD